MKKAKPYLVATGIVLGIFLSIFVVKGIFPFGNNTLIYSDMYDQITAFYYHFYDCFRGNNSLFINFSTSGGINFFGILAYYLISPFNFLLFLFDRDKIYLAVSLIVALKVLMSVLTSLYFIKNNFKKIPWLLSVTLAILYGFSGYTMSMYLITPWMDALYMFPLIMMGLKKVLDLESPLFYITTLTISIILCFYISYMVVIFIFFASLIYLLVYKTKEERKKAIVLLGVSTILSLLLSLFVVLPTYDQISLSSRLSSSFDSIFNSKLGPIVDKTSFFMTCGLYLVGILLLLIDYKKNKKTLSWYLPTCMIVFIPYLIEPVNKIWHFGTYAFFPYRFGFIAIFMLLVGACLYFNRSLPSRKKIPLKVKIIVSFVAIISSSIIVFITSHFYQRFQREIDSLSISSDKLLFVLLVVMMLLTMAVIFTSLKLTNRTKFNEIVILLITIVNITSLSFLYFGMDFDQKRMTGIYKDLELIADNYQENDYFRVKNISLRPITNNGMVMKYHNLDHFTSLTDGNNLKALKLLGFNSTWTKTYSNNGTLFTDLLLANKYLLKNKEINKTYDFYKYRDTYGNFDFYESILDISYGYFIKNNKKISEIDDSFEIQNMIYQSITGNEEDLFKVYNDFEYHNLKIVKDKKNTNYEIIDQDRYSYLEKNLTVKDKQVVYLNLYHSLNNVENYAINKLIDIYLNDQLLVKDFPNDDLTGTINLGVFEKEKVNIKVVIKDSLQLKNISIGVMNLEKVFQFSKSYKIDNKIKFSRNKIVINIDSKTNNLLFIPVTYSKGYTVKINGENAKVEKVFDNYLGVEVLEGKNEIVFTFIPPKLKVASFISAFTLILTLLLFKFNLFFKLTNSKIMQVAASKIYIFSYLLVLLLMYIFPTICFILSFFITIKL